MNDRTRHTSIMERMGRIRQLIRREFICIPALAVLAVPLFYISRALYGTGLSDSLRLTATYLFLIPAARIDHKLRIIPNKLLPVGIAISLVFLLTDAFTGSCAAHQRLLSSFAGMLFGGGIFTLAAILSKGGVGMGDVKLFGVLGFMLEIRVTFNLIFFTLLCAAVCCVYMLAAKKADMKTRVAAAPFALAGMAAAIIAGG